MGLPREVAARPRLVGVYTATFVVVANMVGAGVFTSLGLQAAAVHSPFLLLAIWLIGGAYALCGALSYGELATAFPRSGGEYHYLARIYHPAIGFLGGWVSVTVGFAAPVAAAAMALGHYLGHVFPRLGATGAAFAVVAAVSAVHLGHAGVRIRFQGLLTSFKILLILLLCAGALALAPAQTLDFSPHASDARALFSAPFAICLVYVSYAYSGWNASVYIAGEIADPARNVPRSLLLGTTAVTALYLLLNFAFLRSTPLRALEGQVEVGYVAASAFLGPPGARAMALLISFGLVSSVSSMVWAGPRVLMVLGQDFPGLRWLAPVSRGGVPRRALLIQTALVLVLIATSTFDRVVTCLGFVLSACAMLTVLGVFVDRARRPRAARPYRAWGFPATPAAFVLMTAGMLAYLIRFRTGESLVGLATLALGVPVYFWARPTAHHIHVETGDNDGQRAAE